MLRRLQALASVIAVLGAGTTPCAAAAIARTPAAAVRAGHHEHAEYAADAGACHGPTESLVPHCDCGCTSDRPHAVSSSTTPAWSLPEAPTPGPSAPARAAPVAAPAPCADAPRPRIDHVPIAS
jgi:hypothetical protein